MSRAPALWLAAASLVLSSSAFAAGPAPAQLGQDLAGESCGWADPAAASLAPGAPRTMPIVCGAQQSSAGTLYVETLPAALPADPGKRAQAIVDAARGGAALGSAAPKTCDPPQKIANGDSLAFFCTLQSNGWPRLVLASVRDSALYEAEGLPAMLPVLETAIAQSSGHALSAEETEAAVRMVQARFPKDVARAGGADQASYKALVALGRLDAAANDYAGAESAYRRALDIESKMFGPESMAAAEVMLELALEVSNQERFDEAAGLFRRAEPIISASSAIAPRARLASYRALDAANQRHFADALKFAEAATAMRRAELKAQGDEDNPSVWNRGELAHSLRIEAAMALRLGDLSTALASATEVLRIVADEPSLPLWWRPEAVGMMAEIDARRQEVVPAEREFREALKLDRTIFGDTAPTAEAGLRLAAFYVDQQVYPGALEAFRPALDILARDPVARAGVAPDEIVPFITAAAIEGQQHPEKRAALDAEIFRASQLVGSDVAGQTDARATARLAASNPKLAPLVAQLDEADREREQIRIALVAETAKPNDRRDGARQQKLAQDLATATSHQDMLQKEIAGAFPDYARLADPGPVALGDIERQLGQGEAFLTYVIGAKGGYALLVASDGLSVAKLDTNADALAASVGDLRAAFVPKLGKLPSFGAAGSYQLYQHVLAPVEPKLAGIDRLIVVPTGALASLPMALLVTAPPGPTLGADAWLVRRMAVSDVPSPRAFLTLRAAEARPQSPRAILAVADPSFTGPTAGDADTLGTLAGRCRENGPMPADLLRALPPLKETAGEVQTVAHLVGGNGDTILLGGDATERNFRAQPLDQYRVLYFATHGLLPGELHCQAEPSLVLSPPAQAATSTDDDGLLEASEIAGLRLNADLVVLSACNTAASGGKFGGEALSGLADAFFNAGARAVLASHWEVPSLATVRLMTGVFAARAQNSGLGYAQALRQAQLALIAAPDTSHPYYWAAFTLLGDGGGKARTANAPTQDTTRGPT